MTRSLDDQLVKYLTDAHSIEEQALQQLRKAPDIAGDAELARVFREHSSETEHQKRRVRERLDAHGAKPSRIEDIVMRAGGEAFLLFARFNPDTPGKLTAHAYSYEHLELAAYELLGAVAERAADEDTVTVARAIRDEEAAMADRLARCFDRAVDASLREVGREDLGEQLVKYLVDAHALESQAIQLLGRGPKIAGDDLLARAYEAHLAETREHQRLVAERLEALGAGPSRIQDAAMRLGALNWGAFFQAQRDTPGKLAAFAFAFEHLEIAGYEQLRRVAERAGDQATVEAARQILTQERAAAQKLAALFERAVDASLEAVGVT